MLSPLSLKCINNQNSFKIHFKSNFSIPYDNLYDKYEQTSQGLKSVDEERQMKAEYMNYSTSSLWNMLNKENKEKQYIILKQEEIFDTSLNAKALMDVIDGFNSAQKEDFVKTFCAKTGFPLLCDISLNMESEILRAVKVLSKKYKFDTKFIGYDSNSSVGRKTALPGSDCDGLFIVIEPQENKEEYFQNYIRWVLKDEVNQRIVSTPSLHLPEVITINYIEDGLNLAQKLYDEARFNLDDLKRFEEKLNDDSIDFVKSAEFNISLAKKIPFDSDKKEKLYKTAMFVELLRDGKILENNFSPDFINKIRKSPLYHYSNIMKQQGLKNASKQKYINRTNLEKRFNFLSDEEKFEIIRDILSYSLGFNDVKYKDLFLNQTKDGRNEMGNITQMYKDLT